MNLKVLLLVFIPLLGTSAFAEESVAVTPDADPARRVRRTRVIASDGAQGSPSDGHRFDLDFRGGNPRALVEAINKASGEPLNLIISPECDDLKLPPLRLKNVTTSELLTTLKESSRSVEKGEHGFVDNIAYNFQTVTGLADDAIWYLSPYPNQNQKSARICKIYSLTYCLTRFTVDDITTALTTTWQLQGTELPKMAFHKETQLLIVVGDYAQHRPVSDVLNALTDNINADAQQRRLEAALPKPRTAPAPAPAPAK